MTEKQDAVDDGPNRIILLPQDVAGASVITSTVTINESGIYIVGENRRGCQIKFAPTANDVCFHFVHPSAGILFYGGVKRLTFTTTDSTYEKTAILLEDMGIFELRRDIHFCTTQRNTTLKYLVRQTPPASG